MEVDAHNAEVIACGLRSAENPGGPPEQRPFVPRPGPKGASSKVHYRLGDPEVAYRLRLYTVSTTFREWRLERARQQQVCDQLLGFEEPSPRMEEFVLAQLRPAPPEPMPKPVFQPQSIFAPPMFTPYTVVPGQEAMVDPTPQPVMPKADVES